MPSRVKLSNRFITRTALAHRLGYRDLPEKFQTNRQGFIREDNVGCWMEGNDGRFQLYQFVDEDMNDGQMDLVEIVQ